MTNYTHTHAYNDSNTHPKHTHKWSQPLPPPHTVTQHTHNHKHSVPHSLSLFHTHSLSLSHTHTESYIHTQCLTHTHTNIYTHTHTESHTHTQTPPDEPQTLCVMSCTCCHSAERPDQQHCLIPARRAAAHRTSPGPSPDGQMTPGKTPPAGPGWRRQGAGCRCGSDSYGSAGTLAWGPESAQQSPNTVQHMGQRVHFWGET